MSKLIDRAQFVDLPVFPPPLPVGAIRSILEKGLEKIKIPSNIKKVVIIIEDISRSKSVLDVEVIKYIAKYFGEKNTSIVVANGLHRAISYKELGGSLGPLLKRLRLYNHNPLRGFSPFLEGDYFRVAIGTVMPHPYTGFSGGGKIICPGLISGENIVRFHRESGAKTMALHYALENKIDFLVNAVVNKVGWPIGLFAGDPLIVHKQAIRLAKKVYKVKIIKDADVAILEPYIKNTDFIQSMNALQICRLDRKRPYQLVRKGGTIIITSKTPDGLGTHYMFQQPNGLFPAKYDKVGGFAKVLKNRTLGFVCPNISQSGIQEYFDRGVWNFKNIKEFDPFMRIQYGKNAKVVWYRGSDMMWGLNKGG